MNHRKLFINPQQESQFRDDGYFTIQLLDKDDIAYLLSVFETVKPSDSKNFYSTIDINELEYRQEVESLCRVRMEAKVIALFEDYYPLVFNFIVKRPGADSEVFLHVDDTHVDESKFQTANIWCPLVDTNELNGGLFVLPKSHRLSYPIRGLNIPQAYTEFHHLVKPKMIPVPLKAGEAVIYNNKLMHRSNPNLSNAVRPAIITGMLPKEAKPIIHFHHEGLGANEVEVFALDKDFYLKMNRNERPDFAKSLGIVPYNRVEVSEEVFLAQLNALESKIGFVQKIKNLLKPKQHGTHI